MNSNLCEAIRTKLDANTGTKFNDDMQKCLSILYRYKNMTCHPTKQPGGDGGTDFYIEETNEYYAFSSGQNYSFDDLAKKIKNDLSVLFKSVYNDHIYTGKIEKVIFVFATHGQGLANDKEGKIKNIFGEFIKKYGEFKYEVLSVSDFCDILAAKEDQEVIERIAKYFNIDTELSSAFIEILDLLSKVEDTEFTEKSFVRYSTDDKIYKNDLTNLEERINELLTSEYYSRLVDVITQEEYEQKFNTLKNQLANIYYEQKKKFKGEGLLQKIIDVFKNNYHVSYKTSELLVVFIFDHCDIFSDCYDIAR